MSSTTGKRTKTVEWTTDRSLVSQQDIVHERTLLALWFVSWSQPMGASSDFVAA